MSKNSGPGGGGWRGSIASQPGSLKTIVATTPTPKGLVKLDLTFGQKGPHGVVTLPEGLPGTFVWGSRRTPLVPGENKIASPRPPSS